MRELTDLFKALADESRLRALYALKGGELCVCQLIALLDLAPSTVSKHLSILRSARLVDSRKQGRWMHYRLSREFRTPSAGRMVALLLKDMEGMERMAEDRKRMKKIADEGVEAVCKRLFCKP
jgi:ArsR family transcriptional regulator, arsenate/arsenite/antimonite-responsive transcriptional repressor